jgi:hypothetical protein
MIYIKYLNLIMKTIYLFNNEFYLFKLIIIFLFFKYLFYI